MGPSASKVARHRHVNLGLREQFGPCRCHGCERSAFKRMRIFFVEKLKEALARKGIQTTRQSIFEYKGPILDRILYDVIPMFKKSEHFPAAIDAFWRGYKDSEHFKALLAEAEEEF